MGKENFKFGSINVLKNLIIFVERQVDILEELPVNLPKKRIELALPLINGISSNVSALILLSKNNFGNEVCIVLRAVLEKIITFFYLQVCSDIEYDNYIKYSKQKTYRKMEQVLNIKNRKVSIKLKNKFNLSLFPDLKEAVDKFTSTKGKPITHWSKTSITKKIEVIQESEIIDSTLIMMATLVFYDDCSEALHGTVYGMFVQSGVFQPGIIIKKPEDMTNYYHGWITMTFWILGLLLNQLNEYVNKKCKFKNLLKLSKKTKKEVIDFMKKVVD